MAKAREILCDILIESGVEYVFGVPGGGAWLIFDSLFDRQDKIKVILARHEQGAACMADMYGRLTGKPGILIGQGAFIGSSGLFGIIDAYLGSAPMIVLTDESGTDFMQPTKYESFAHHALYQCGTGEYGNFDLLSILRSASKYTAMAATPKEAVQGLQLAIKHATTGRPGPACVIMRASSIAGEVDPKKPPRLHKLKGYISKNVCLAPEIEIERTLTLLSSAKHPIIIAGGGIHTSKAYDELIQIAELFCMPVATSYKGKSTFPETHSLSLGPMGAFGQCTANTSIGEADLLLVIGCKLSPMDTFWERQDIIDPERQTIIQIDIDSRNAGWVFPVEISLIGDVKAIMQQIIDMSIDVKENFDNRITSLAQRKSELGFFKHPALYSDSTPIMPERLVKSLQDNLEPSAIIALDAGNNRVWMTHLFKCRHPATIFGPSGIGGMGWAPPASLAAKLVHPDRTCVSVSGDGGFMMSLHVLSTSREYDLPVIFVVMNNSALGMVMHSQGERIIASELVETNYAEIAQAFGCEGIRVDKPQDLAPAINKAVTSKRSTVIDVVINHDERLATALSYEPKY